MNSFIHERQYYKVVQTSTNYNINRFNFGKLSLSSKTEILYNLLPKHLTPGHTHTTERHSHIPHNTYFRMFVAVLFVITPHWKPSGFPSSMK